MKAKRFFQRLAVSTVGVLVLAVILAVAVFPTRTYLDQRQQLAATEKRIKLLDAENKRLEARVQKLHTDAEIERLAREQYNLVRPGEDAYAILPAPGDPPPTTAPVHVATPHRDHRSFWQRIKDLVHF